MRPYPLMLLAALMIPTASTHAADAGDGAPDRVVRFYELRFEDTQRWSCARECDEPSSRRSAGARKGTQGETENGCLACTATGPSDIAVLRAADGEDETVTASAVDLCADALIVRNERLSSPPSPAPPSPAPAANPDLPENSPDQTATDGGEIPVDSGVRATVTS